MLLRDYSINLADVTNIVNRGLLLFLMKATKIDELLAFKTNDITKSVALLFYGTYSGFSKIDRVIYEEVGADVFIKSWLDWLVYFYQNRTPNSAYLTDEDISGVLGADTPVATLKNIKNMKLFK